jgi:outer membrane lipoprotein-sorting protein
VKQRMCLKLAICSLLVLMVAPGFAVQPPQPQPFSADLTMTIGKGGENITGKVYSSLPMMRWDMNTHGRNMSMISNNSTQTTYLLWAVNTNTNTTCPPLPAPPDKRELPAPGGGGCSQMQQQHMYMEMHANQTNPMMRNMPKFDGSFDPQNPCGKHADVTCKKAGTETVNGRVCDKWVTTEKNGHTSTSWVDQKLYVPIKVVSSEGTTMDLTHIKEGAQPASTFEVPAGYRKMDLGGMMGGDRPPQ